MSERRPRVLVVLAATSFLRNFMQSRAFDELDADHEVRIIAAEHLRTAAPTLPDDPRFAGWFAGVPEIERRHFVLFSVLMWRYRSWSSSFRFRARRTLGYQYLHLLRTPHARGRRRWAIGRLLREHVLRPGTWSMLVLGTPPITGPFVRAFVARRLPVNPHLQQAIAANEPDVVLFPSSAYDPVGNDVSRIASDLGVTSVFLIDNWDNLSSKSLFWSRPDHVGVWGPQSRDHAERIQRFRPEQVHEIGTPRFDGYLADRERELPSPYDFPYALFVGCALPFDEVAALHLLDDEIDAHPDRYGDLTVVYRPHPGHQERLIEEPFDEARFRHVVLDHQMREHAASGRTGLPDLDHYGPLLRNARAVVAPLTTMLIEALIFTKPVLVIAYDDGIHFTNPRAALAAYEHFTGIGDLDLVWLCEEQADLVPQFRDVVAAEVTATDRARTDDQLRHFLRLDDVPYGARVRDVLDRITGRAVTR